MTRPNVEQHLSEMNRVVRVGCLGCLPELIGGTAGMFGSLTGLAVSRSRMRSATTCRAAVDGTSTLSSSSSLGELDLFESLRVCMGACMLSSKGGSAVLIPPKPLPGVAGVLGLHL